MVQKITPEQLLRAYAIGVFPMAESQNDPEIHWIDPLRRAIIPIDGFHISHSLARTMRRDRYEISLDRDFEGVLDGCAGREETWINAEIHDLYLALHQLGFAHSLEIRTEDELTGGVYGVVLGAAFFGESMFSRRRDASKLALAHLVAHLRAGGFTLFDTQFLTEHLASLGAIEISRDAYRKRLKAALSRDAVFAPQPPAFGATGSRQCSTQTS